MHVCVRRHLFNLSQAWWAWISPQHHSNIPSSCANTLILPPLPAPITTTRWNHYSPWNHFLLCSSFSLPSFASLLAISLIYGSWYLQLCISFAFPPTLLPFSILLYLCARVLARQRNVCHSQLFSLISSLISFATSVKLQQHESIKEPLSQCGLTLSDKCHYNKTRQNNADHSAGTKEMTTCLLAISLKWVDLDWNQVEQPSAVLNWAWLVKVVLSGHHPSLGQILQLEEKVKLMAATLQKQQ